MAVLAGCGSAQRHAAPKSHSVPAAGVVSGTLGIRGGVFNTGVGTRCRCEALPGTVRLTRGDGRRFRVDAGKSGKFSVRVPAGRYDIVAGLKRPYEWPMGTCDGLSGIGARFDRKTNSFYAVVGKNAKLDLVVVCQAA